MLSQWGAEMFAKAAVPLSKELISWAILENSTHVFPMLSIEHVKRKKEIFTRLFFNPPNNFC